MNPFELTGPDFLALYVPLTVIAVGWALYRRMLPPPGGIASSRRLDPYALAYLARGADESLRMAVLMLLHRKLLRSKADQVLEAAEAGSDKSIFPLERALFAAAPGPLDVDDLAQRSPVATALDELEHGLQRDGLMVDPTWLASHRRTAALVLLALASIGLIKLVIALERGRYNVGWLILCMAALLIALVTTSIKRHWPSTRGRRLLADLRRLLAPRRRLRIDPDDDPAQTMLICAVFGTHTMRGDIGMNRRRLFPQRAATSSGSSCSATSCGSSCGSSSGASGSSCSSSGGSSCSSGSSCGGGGCGGCGGS